MDSASIAPIFQPDGARHYFRDAKNLRDALRERLSAAYGLQDFSLFLVPSVTHGMLALAQLLTSHGRHVGLARGNHYAPIEQLFRPLSRHGGVNPDALIATHVCPYTGTVQPLSNRGAPVELVDASHSFATNLHRELVDSARVFVAPFHKHAALAVGLALVAVRHDLAGRTPYGMLSLLESSTAAQAPLLQALHHLDESGTSLCNKAAIGKVRAPQGVAALVRVSNVELALPFACFRHEVFARLDKTTLRNAGATYFPDVDTLRIARWKRGAIGDPAMDLAPDVQATIAHLFQTL